VASFPASPRPEDLPPVADVLIIGAGAGGSVAAATLAARGMSVVVLEQGTWADPDQYLSSHPEAELAWAERWNPDPLVRANPEDYPVTGPDADIRAVMFNGVGGSMISWAGMWHPLMPSDFRVRTDDGVADDWPITYADLKPFYERVARTMGVSGLDGDPLSPPMDIELQPPIPIGRVGRRAARGMNALGWHWWPGTNAISSRERPGLHRCRLWGTCMIGCPEGAKAHPGLVHWPGALRDGAQLLTGARVHELTSDATGLVTGARWRDRDGRDHHQRAAVTILAANAVGTARLLLLSAGPGHPDGLANSSGLVGRRLMQHPYATVTGFVDESLDGWRGPWGQNGYSLEFYPTVAERGFVRGTKWNLMPVGGPLFHHDLVVGGPDRPWEEAWGPGFHRNLARTFGRGFTWGIQGDDLPDEANHITLDPATADSDGLPGARIHYTVSENSRRMLDWNLERVREAVAAAGATETYEVPLWGTGIGHVLGTACMGDDPATSVVDRWQRAHDVPNLYVMDSSVFVTGGAVNPGASILALALRAAEHLADERRNQPVPL
jgi:choline dehydrogenase-like flavoprotein